jgi:16S rRNA (guanine966-N2)-methyltransferase
LKPTGHKPGGKKPAPAKGGPVKPNRLRIIGGVWRGRLIEAPADDAIRPTTDRVRESLFNRLMHGAGGTGFALSGARVADVFAGTGAMGLEALSRGAAHVTFIERDMTAAALIRRNIATLAAEDRVSVMSADATNLPRAVLAHDLALLDPPYGTGLAAPAMLSLARQGWVRPGGIVTVEMDAGEVPPEVAGYRFIDRREAGRIAVALYQLES